MNNITFNYTGRDLLEPLSSLLANHAAAVDRLNAELAQISKADVDAAGGVPELTRKITPGEARARSLLNQRVEMNVRKRETELWLFECKRTPGATWALTMADLGRIYAAHTFSIDQPTPKRSSWLPRWAS